MENGNKYIGGESYIKYLDYGKSQFKHLRLCNRSLQHLGFKKHNFKDWIIWWLNLTTKDYPIVNYMAKFRRNVMKHFFKLK